MNKSLIIDKMLYPEDALDYQLDIGKPIERLKDIAIIYCPDGEFNLYNYAVIAEGFFGKNYRDAYFKSLLGYYGAHHLWLPDGNGCCRITDKKPPYNKFMGVLGLEYLLHNVNVDPSECYLIGISRTNFRVDIRDIF